jgi:hypothetical protein
VAERLTAPLAPADPAVIAIWDATHRVAPWLWWPFEVPDPRRPLKAPDHAHFVAHAALGFLAGEVLRPARARTLGGEAARRRAGHLGRGHLRDLGGVLGGVGPAREPPIVDSPA